MADIYRQVYTSFWQDPFVLSLTPEEKYFYLYLFTNSKTSLCGIYELPLKVVEFETGYNRETVEKLINNFEKYKKIKYSTETSEICVCNFIKYNVNRSPKLKSAVDKAFSDVKDKKLIGYVYGIDTISSETVTDTETVTETVKEYKEKTSSKLDYQSIADLFNSLCPSYPKVTKLSDARKKAIKARFSSGYTYEDFRRLFSIAEQSDFLKGKNNRKWKANFDWLIKDANMAKVLDGNYANSDVKEKPKQNTSYDLDKFREKARGKIEYKRRDI